MEWPTKYDPGYIPPPDSEYWNPRMETMEPGERDEIVLQKIEHQVRYAFNSSPFYQEFYKDVGVDPTRIRSFEELQRLPILTKEDIRLGAGEAFPFRAFLVRT